MRKRLAELQRKRGQLVERIAHQRATLARESAPLRAACDTTDRVLATVRSTARQVSRLVARHPAETAGLVVALIALKPRRVVRWLGRAIVVWRGWHSVRPWLPRW